MLSFLTVLVSGTKRPYHSWTFVVVPDQVCASFCSKRAKVSGKIKGVGFTSTVSNGEIVYRMPVPRAGTRIRKAANAPDGIRNKNFPET